jgi:hypothetical protein
MAAKPKPPDTWHVFAIPEMPVRFDHDYPVAITANSPTGATVDAAELASKSGAQLVCALHPDGYVGRVGPASHLAPPFLQGDFVRLHRPAM